MKILLVSLIIFATIVLKAETGYRYIALELAVGNSKQLAAFEKFRIHNMSLKEVGFGKAIASLLVTTEDQNDFGIVGIVVIDPEDNITSKIVSLDSTDITISEIIDRLCIQAGAIWLFDGNTLLIKPKTKTEPNQSLQTTNRTVTDCAPSSTLRASAIRV